MYEARPDAASSPAPPSVVIALVGPSRVGKDSLAAALSNLYRQQGFALQTRGLADAIWGSVRALIGGDFSEKGSPDRALRQSLTTDADADGTRTSTSTGSSEPRDRLLDRAATPRQWAIAVGEGARRHFDPTIWVRLWWRGVSAPHGIVVIPDARRADEILTLREILPAETQLRIVGLSRPDLSESDQVWEAGARHMCEINLDLVTVSGDVARTNYYRALAESLVAGLRQRSALGVADLRRRLLAASVPASAEVGARVEAEVAGAVPAAAAAAAAGGDDGVTPPPATVDGGPTAEPEPEPELAAVLAAAAEPVPENRGRDLYDVIRRTALAAGVVAAAGTVGDDAAAAALVDELGRVNSDVHRDGLEAREALVESYAREAALEAELAAYRRALLGSGVALHRSMFGDDSGASCVTILVERKKGKGGDGEPAAE